MSCFAQSAEAKERDTFILTIVRSLYVKVTYFYVLYVHEVKHMEFSCMCLFKRIILRVDS